MRFTDTSEGKNIAKDPAVVNFKGRYLMYYSVPGINGWGLGIAQSKDLDNWTKIAEVPSEQPCEEKGICAPGAIVLDGTVHLFYQTYGNREKDAICHAVSENGVDFVKNPTNPIFSPTGDWNCGRAIDADVVAWGDKLILYFATRTPDYKTQIIGVASAPIGSDFSKNCWQQICSDTILKPELAWEGQCIEAPASCIHDSKIYMFYAGAYNNSPQQIGCAVSTDGVEFKRLFNKPFLPCGKKGEWNESESGHPFIFEDDDKRIYLFFQGNNDNGKSWYLSKKEVAWNGDMPFIIE